eukprot:TRINITY_DN17711_c0_g1_i1.p1 TRINITY_DN17711_c0_g1~~TRINITY_DN17711_c0_g1_i1.p1  ORF type:complete len:300 (+),score=98.65 TRINITY_DN17711_c0_g1_i1:79-978(+)
MGAEADLDVETLKRLKREAAIRAKEDDFERRKKAEEKKKRALLDALKKEYEQEMVRREQDRIAMLKKQTELRAAKKAENDRLNNKRDALMKERQEAWLNKANGEIFDIMDQQALEDERLEKAIQGAREAKHEREMEARKKVMDKQARQEELEMTRAENLKERAHQRDTRALERVDVLKMEAREELQSFIENPFPVPLKQVLAGRMRPVPTVTELLAAYKDQREDLEQLQKEDIGLRAQLRNQSIFGYVHEIQLKAEADRMVPPEPVAGDLTRTRGKKEKTGAASPTGGTRNKLTGSRRR